MALKFCWMMLVLAALLSGCAAEETMETVADDLVQPVAAMEPRQIDVRLPDGAIAPVLETGTEQMYLTEEYELLVQTVSSGDLEGTIDQICGYRPEDLTIMQTHWDGVDRYEFVWAAAGEKGDQLGRAVILDDGHYHYCMSVLRNAQQEKTSQVVWRDVFDSFTLV